MRLPPPSRAAGTLLLLMLAPACTFLPDRQSRPAGEEAAAQVTPTATHLPKAGPLAVASPSAPSGILYRVGWKSDAAEFLYGPPGQRWVVAAGGKAELLRGSFRFRPEGRAGAAFAIQVGAFSTEEVARQMLDRLSADFSSSGTVAFSADRGIYRVLLGQFSDRASADSFAERLRSGGQQAIVIEAASGMPSGALISVTGEDGILRRLSPPVDIFPADPDSRVVLDGKPYRGSVRVVFNARGLLNIVNRVDLEEYLYGVVPAEMGPKRYDEVEALKAQAVAARTYALAHRGQFEAEGYDICATPKCQVYAGLSAEDPLSSAAVDGTRGLVLAHDGHLADALFISTCGGRTENVENIFSHTPEPYLVSVECAELATTVVPGAPLLRAKEGSLPRSGLAWRGYVLRRHAPRGAAIRASLLKLAQEWAGAAVQGSPPAKLVPSAVYPSLIAAFDLRGSREIHLLARDEAYYAEPPAASGRLSGAALGAYDFLIRFRLGAGESLPAADEILGEEQYGGLLFSAALRLAGVSEGSGRFLRREGGTIWLRTPEGRLGLPVDPELPLARRVGDRYYPSASLVLRAGDRLRWWKRGSRLLALWVEMDSAGPSFERESSWTEWVRRLSGRELARRMAQRVAGVEVRELKIVRRSPSGRVIEMEVVTDAARLSLKRFEVRQALELPELLFAMQKVRGADGEDEWVFLGRGWGHGVGLCQNGAYGMALAGATYDEILRHYYVGAEIVPAARIASLSPSVR